MARKDVDLVIRAKDEAVGTLSAVTKALNNFIAAQTDIEKVAPGTESALDKLGAAIATLEKQVTSGDLGGKISRSLDEAAASVARMESRVEATREELGQLEQRLASVGQEAANAKVKFDAAAAAMERQQRVAVKTKTDIGELADAYKRSVAEQAALEKRQAAIPGEIERLSVAVEKAKRRFDELSAKMAETVKPSTSLTEKFASSQRNVAKLDSSLASLQAELTEVNAKLDETRTYTAIFAEQSQKAAAALKQEEAVLGAISADYGRLAAESKALSSEETRLQASVDKTSNALERHVADLKRAEGAYVETAAKARAFDDAITSGTATGKSQLEAQLVGQAIAARQAREAMQKLQASVVRLQQDLSFEQALRGNSNAARQMADDLAFATQRMNQAEFEFMAQEEAARDLGLVYRQTSDDLASVVAAQTRFAAVQERLSATMKEIAEDGLKERNALRDIGTTADRAAASVNRVASANERASSSTNAFSRAYHELYGASRQSLSIQQRLRGEVLSFIAAYGGLYGVINLLGRVVSAYQTLEGAQARLNVANRGDTAKTADDFDFLRRTANQLGIELGNLATEYSKFSIATQGTNLEGEKTRKIFLAVAQAARVNRSSNEEMQGVFTALTQIVSKGAVQMEELRQQLGDRLPGALQIMADGLGVTTAELIKMMEQGRVSAEALVPFAEELNKRFGPGLEEALSGVTVALGRLKNAAFQALVLFGQAGFIDSFALLANEITDFLQSADFASFAQRASAAFTVLIDALRFVVRNFDLFVVLGTTFAGLKLAKPILLMAEGLLAVGRNAKTAAASLVGMQVAAARSTAAVGAAGAAATGLLRFAGPVGLVISAIGLGIGLWATNTEQATEALTAHQRLLDQVKDGYDAVGGSVDEWRAKLNEITQQQAVDNVEATFRTLEDSLDKLDKVLSNAGKTAFQSGLGPGSGLFFGASRDYIKAVRTLIQNVSEGKISVFEFREELDNLANQYRDTSAANARMASQLDKVGQEVETSASALDQAKKILAAVAGEAGVAQRAFDLLAGKVRDANVATSEFDESLSKVKTAADALVGVAPKIKADQDDIALLADDFRRHYETALSAARALPDAIQRAAAEQKVLNESAEGFAAIARHNEEVMGQGFGGTLVDRIIGVESGGNANAKNPLSSATGLGQFISSTWLALFKKHFPERAVLLSDAAILELRKDATLSRQMVALYLRENAEVLRSANVAITDANLYLTHFLGPGGAVALLNSAPGTIANNVLGSDQIAANASILDGKTREEIIAWAQRKVGVSREELDIQETLVENDEKRRENVISTAEEALKSVEAAKKATAERLSDQEFEVRQQELVNQGLARQAAIEAAIREAKNENKNITAAQIQQVAEHAGRLYDLQQIQKGTSAAAEAAEKAEERVNLLIEKRAALEEQMEIARENGNTTLTSDLQGKLAEVNAELIAAIENAKKMWEAVGGEEASTKLATLDAARAQAENFGKAAQKNYLEWSRLGDLFVNGLAGAFDAFSRAVAEGKSIGEAARDAFLQFASDFLREIAQMILKQAIFNALRAAFGGTSFGGLIGVGHTGGIVGQKRVSGNGARRVDASAFAGALRYHGGGIAGLAPGEVPIIAKQGEEILTEDNPFHANNRGNLFAGSPAESMAIRIVNAIDSASFLEAALATDPGEQAILNWIQANQGAVRSAMGG